MTCRTVLVVPEVNRTMEPEMAVLCPELAPFAVARVPLPSGHVTRETLPQYAESTRAAAEPFLAKHPDLVVHGCTAAGFLAGREANARMVATLCRGSDAAVVSTAEAMIDALRSDGISNVAVATPYLDAVNEGLRSYLAAAGIAVETLVSLKCETTKELCAVTVEQVRDLALRTVTPRSQALLIACSQLPTLGIIEQLRELLQIPVWSSIRATAWAASQAITKKKSRSGGNACQQDRRAQ